MCRGCRTRPPWVHLCHLALWLRWTSTRYSELQPRNAPSLWGQDLGVGVASLPPVAKRPSLAQSGPGVAYCSYPPLLPRPVLKAPAKKPSCREPPKGEGQAAAAGFCAH